MSCCYRPRTKYEGKNVIDYLNVALSLLGAENITFHRVSLTHNALGMHPIIHYGIDPPPQKKIKGRTNLEEQIKKAPRKDQPGRTYQEGGPFLTSFHLPPPSPAGGGIGMGALIGMPTTERFSSYFC